MGRLPRERRHNQIDRIACLAIDGEMALAPPEFQILAYIQLFVAWVGLGIREFLSLLLGFEDLFPPEVEQLPLKMGLVVG